MFSIKKCKEKNYMIWQIFWWTVLARFFSLLFFSFEVMRVSRSNPWSDLSRARVRNNWDKPWLLDESVWVQIYVRTYTHTYIHTYIHTPYTPVLLSLSLSLSVQRRQCMSVKSPEHHNFSDTYRVCVCVCVVCECVCT